MDGINPGELRDLIQVFKITRVSDGRGGNTPGPDQFFFETFAKIVPMKPITDTSDGKLTVYQPFNVVIRYSDTRKLEPDMKVTYGGDRYLIKNILPVDTRKRRVSFMMIKL